MSQDSSSWLDAPGHRVRLYQALVGACVVLLGVDILGLYEPHVYPGFEFLEMPGFFAVFGFGATIGLVQGAYALRERLGRDEDYYEAAPTQDGDPHG